MSETVQKTNGFQNAFGQDEESLQLFLKKVQEFDQAFCDLMAKGCDFTLRLEVRGNQGVLLHSRVYRDDIERPDGAQKKIDEKTARLKAVG